MKLSENSLKYLKESSLPWIKYGMMLHDGAGESELKKIKLDILKHPSVAGLMKDATDLLNIPMRRHNDVSHPLHKLYLLSEMGILSEDDKNLSKLFKTIVNQKSTDDALRLLVDIPESYGGTGQSPGWLMCDFPTLLYVVISMDKQSVKTSGKAVDFLKRLSKGEGWPCTGSFPKFRGPGRKDDHCPYATLISLRALALIPELRDCEQVKTGIDVILDQWTNRKTKKYYLFAMGTDFQKLKYPSIWFDILSVCKTLSNYPYAKKSKQFKEMISIITSKQLSSGGFVPESVFLAYKGWDFGQKKIASPSLTLSIMKLLKNC